MCSLGLDLTAEVSLAFRRRDADRGAHGHVQRRADAPHAICRPEAVLPQGLGLGIGEANRIHCTEGATSIQQNPVDEE